MSEVLLGQQVGDAGFRKLVVLKRVASDSAFDESAARDMLIREARLTAGFVHSNIAQVFDLEEHEGSYYLAMEFVPGVTLLELLQRAGERGNERLPVGLCLSVARDVAEALHYAHTFMTPAGKRQAVIHRDVAHKNVMLRWDGVTKLLDFGLVKRLGGPSLTREGFVKGTVDFMSPEQIRGEALDGRSDVFSLAVMLYEMLAGAPITTPADPTPPARRPSLPPITSRVPDLPPALDKVLAKALMVDRNLRTLTARELARELSRAGGDLLWEPEAISGYLQHVFGEERAKMEQMVAKLTGDEVSSPNGQPVDADKRTELVTPEQLRAALSGGGAAPDPHAAKTELKTAEEIAAELGPSKAQPITDPLMPPPEPKPRPKKSGRRPSAPLLLALFTGAATLVVALAWWLNRLLG